VQEPSEPTWPPYRSHERHGWRGDRDWQPGVGWPHRAHRVRRWWHRGNGEPLRRDPEDRLAGGVAAGVGAWRGFSPTTVRVVFVVVALISQGWMIPFYLGGWLLIPSKDTGVSIWSRARHDSRGIALAVGLGSLLCVLLGLASVLNSWLINTYGWQQVASVAFLVLIWRNAPDSEQTVIRHLVEPLESLGGGEHSTGRSRGIRIAAAIALLASGFGWLLTSNESVALLRPLAGLILVTAGIVVLLGPWWLRIARDLVLERQARARAEERADISSHIHDSVLQTLALIQRRADDPQQVVQLARAQERELRSWLFEGRTLGDGDATTVNEGVRQIQRDVEARHGVPVEVVTVGDCSLDDDLNALLAAAREATVNAAKWSGAGVISVYAEVEPERVEVAVRDRGKGFDPDAVPGDRKGLAESVHGRMSRHGGTVTVNSAVGEGTKVTLTMPRSGAPAEAKGGSRR
jgi:signal transduction histidine kinase